MSNTDNNLRRFDGFCVDIVQRVLLFEGSPVLVPPKVFDTLLLLIENHGRIVTKRELMDSIWPDTFVEESNLAYNIGQLRKTLNDDARSPHYIETVARRGYRFIAPLEDAIPAPLGVAQDVAADADLTKQGPDRNPSLPEYAPVSPSDHFTQRSVALAAVVVIAVFGVVSALWKLSPEQSTDKSAAAQPLNIERITSTGDSYNPAISPDGKYAAYTRIIDRKYSIWLRQLSTNTSLQVTTTDHEIVGLAFANSGEQLFYVEGGPKPALWQTSVLGGVPSKLIDGLTGKFSVSGDDQHVAFVRASPSDGGKTHYELTVANVDGTGERVLLDRPYPEKIDVPLWSPDHRSVICAYGSSAGEDRTVRLIEVDATTGAWHTLGGEQFAHINSMVWLSGNGMLMAARRGQNEERRLWHLSFPELTAQPVSAQFTPYANLSITAAGDRLLASDFHLVSDIWTSRSSEQKGLKKIVAAIDNFCWTRDDRLIYSSMAGGSRNIWSMLPDGSDQKQLTRRAATDGSPAATFDGTYIVFVSTDGGSLQIWRMRSDGTEQTKLTDGDPKNFPTVSPDGRWVYYNSTKDWTLWRVPLAGGEPLQVTGYPCEFPAVSPDGRSVACLNGRSERELMIISSEAGASLGSIEVPGQRLGGTRIQWAADGGALVYASYGDGVSTLIHHTINSGARQELGVFEDELFDFGFSAGGGGFAVTRGAWRHDVLLINDFKKYAFLNTITDGQRVGSFVMSMGGYTSLAVN